MYSRWKSPALPRLYYELLCFKSYLFFWCAKRLKCNVCACLSPNSERHLSLNISVLIKFLKICISKKYFGKSCRTIIVHLNIKTILKNKLFSKNKSRCEMGFVDFPYRNTNTSKIFYYSQSLMICLVEQKSHFQLAKMTKMDIVKH